MDALIGMGDIVQLVEWVVAIMGGSEQLELDSWFAHSLFHL